jgi:hypothetical protein
VKPWKPGRVVVAMILVLVAILSVVTLADPGRIIERIKNPGGNSSEESGIPSGIEDAGAGPMPPGVQITVPWAIGGPRIEVDGSLVDFPGEWPDLPINGLRLWDTRTAWLNLEPARGQWDFSRLDAFVAKAESNGVSRIVLVMGGTPRWAGTGVSAAEAAWLGPGSASPPTSMADWDEYVRKVVTRYAGRITGYEIWNEPSGDTFWSGTPGQWAELVARATPIIRSVDPAASVVGSGFVLTGMNDLPRLEPWIAALGSVDPNLTAISVHWYPKAGGDVSRMRAVTRAFRERLRAVGLPTRIWVTEVNVIEGSSLTAAGQRAAIASLQRQATNLRIRQLYWYAWSDLVSPVLIPLYRATPGEKELAAIASRQEEKVQ